MGKQIKAGEKLPFFKYDTPYSAANSFRQLLAEHVPLVLVFMSNFGHPITRTFVGRYAAAMYLLDGLPVAAIAQKLGRPAPTVQNQLFRAKAILRKQIMERRQE